MAEEHTVLGHQNLCSFSLSLDFSQVPSANLSTIKNWIRVRVRVRSAAERCLLLATRTRLSVGGLNICVACCRSCGVS